jgi:hypothetical protein
MQKPESIYHVIAYRMSFSQNFFLDGLFCNFILQYSRFLRIFGKYGGSVSLYGKQIPSNCSIYVLYGTCYRKILPLRSKQSSERYLGYNDTAGRENSFLHGSGKVTAIHDNQYLT